MCELWGVCHDLENIHCVISKLNYQVSFVFRFWCVFYLRYSRRCPMIWWTWKSLLPELTSVDNPNITLNWLWWLEFRKFWWEVWPYWLSSPTLIISFVINIPSVLGIHSTQSHYGMKDATLNLAFTSAFWKRLDEYSKWYVVWYPAYIATYDIQI